MEGHRRGSEAVSEVTRVSREYGISTMTLWAFSTENWNRSKEELSYLMNLYADYADKYLEEAISEGTRVTHLGRKEGIPRKLREKIILAEEKSKDNSKYYLNICLDYGGHDEILRATKKIIVDIQSGKITADDLFKETGQYNGKYPYYLYKDYLDTKDQPFPYPDLIIRTSGEQRLSGFLLWQSVYSELYFPQVHMPDFRREEFEKALLDFASRERRFGGNTKII